MPKVVSVIDPFRLVINRGSQSGVKVGDLFLVYEIGDELFDPDTKESLGRLEIVKGRGKASHVQERLTTLESTESEQVVKRSSPRWLTVLGTEMEETKTLPFNNPKVGDVARSLVTVRQVRPATSPG